MMEVHPGVVTGRIRAPPSKSETHRAFVLAAFADGARVVRPLACGATEGTRRALAALGARPEEGGREKDDVGDVVFAPARLHVPEGKVVPCGDAATTMRFLACVAARQPRMVRLDAGPQLRARPQEDLREALRQLGVVLDGHWPMALRGPLVPGRADVAGASTSQAVSGLLLSLPFLPGHSVVRAGAQAHARSYIDVTLAMLRQAGVRVREPAPGEFHVEGSQEVAARRLQVGGDWSSAAFPLACGAVTGGTVEVAGLDGASPQGDRAIVGILESFGATARVSGGAAEVEGAGLASPEIVDVTDVPDLFPVVAAVAAVAAGTTRIIGGASLRGKESDRIAAMADGLQRLGATVRQEPGALVVRGGRLQGATMSSRGDHRVHMALAVAALAADGPSRIDGGSHASYPGFGADLARLGVRSEIAPRPTEA